MFVKGFANNARGFIAPPSGQEVFTARITYIVALVLR